MYCGVLLADFWKGGPPPIPPNGDNGEVNLDGRVCS